MEPAGYQIKRYSLMAFCVLSIIVYIIVAALSAKIIGEVDQKITAELDNNPQNYPGLKEKDKKEVVDITHKVLIGVLVAFCVIGVLFQLLGQLVQAFRNPVLFASFGYHLLVAIVAILFVIDLSKIRRSKMNAPRY
ncbi:hypothetical protein TYRP_022247 [Tyrophagus putrescentiae]|nr:hypothetical protein TYRP_022247 [Tyrophagus putrescentiae]